MAMNWNYYDTFITVAPDCSAERGIIPPEKKSGRTKPSIEYDLVANNPYKYTQEELLFQTHVLHKEIPQEELEAREAELRAEFFSKPTACLRASMLPKKYGWGLHFDSQGRLALVPRETAEYDRLAGGGEPGVKVLAAMRSSRK
ncbi:hypothetical protein B0G52_107159 [Cohnella sp. SGD-V74]|uniref:DUF6157 family protein n=1 Tax=unclassified Cohnella TaxID=2636738 RepID=UPI000D4F7CED|nr:MULTISPECIES: DUF6157 family protein [unclassified Cohnella]PRX71960.1 hypothetical protein B0G52_107159 [Cohnella sp. SGD-V74]